MARVFTGLVEATGRLTRRTRRGPGYRIAIACELRPLTLGESISVSGACLTVTEIVQSGFEADVSVETNDRTTLGDLAPGGLVNLERSLRVGDRLGGHLVSGHVDGVAEVTAVEPAGEARRVVLRVPRELSAYIAPKGSVTLDGVSLTVNALLPDGFEIMLIPHTLRATTLGSIAPGRRLNLEVDVIARYVVRYLQVTSPEGAPAAVADSENAESALARALDRAGLR